MTHDFAGKLPRRKLLATGRKHFGPTAIAVLAGLMMSCGGPEQAFDAQVAKARLNEIAAKAYRMYSAVKDTTYLPRTLQADGRLHLVSSEDWTSGFFAGYLWYVYEYTNDEKFLHAALRETRLLEKEQFNTTTHDLGFMLYCSYGNALRLTGNEEHTPVLMQAARSLTTRFHPTAGCIKSWDWSSAWNFPVIIDNMMNLELLFWATKASGERTFHDIAVTHANTTMKNHFRADHSSFHVLDYDTLSGEVIARNTHQGLSDNSAWARGQAWGLYGFTIAYRETKDTTYLAQAQRIASFISNHKNLPEDKIPYWDYDAPSDTSTPRDASAAAIAASALLELSQYSNAELRAQYLKFSEKVLASLSSPAYFNGVHENGNFVLKHCVGNKPGNSEVDVPIIYADYYYTEALMRYLKYHGNRN